jgi:suppressor for copper-sensitivity B
MKRRANRWLGNGILSLFLCLTVSQPSRASAIPQQPGPGPGGFPATVTVRFIPETAAAGDTVKLEVSVGLELGFHTYDIVQPELKDVATQLHVDPPSPLEIAGDWSGTKPEDKVQDNTRIFVHYEDPTWSLPLRIPADLSPGEYKVTGKVRLLVCNESGCLPPRTEKFSLTLAVLAGSEGSGSKGASEPANISPQPSDRSLGGDASPTPSPAAAPALTGASLDLPTRFDTKNTDLVIDNVWFALGAGLLAGLILNVMPCVLPVISLKIYGYLKQAGSDRRRIQAMGLAFSAGILAVFLVFGVLFAYAGQTWGELFQSDVFNVIMVAVLVGCTLWMFEVFILTVPGIVGEADAAAAARKDLVGEFAKGMLATLLSTPCSGPLLIPVISFALKTKSPPIIFSTLTAVGIGMGFPYLVLAWKPGWMKLMPKPGDWMRTFKEFMGFLLLGTAIWLLWQRRRNGELVVWTVAFSTFVAMAGWLYGRWADPMNSRAKRLMAPLAALLLIAGGAWFSFGVMYHPPGPIARSVDAGPNAEPPPSGIDHKSTQEYHWKPFDLNEILMWRAKGRTVVVDWTADY